MKVDEDLAKYQACRTIVYNLVYGAGIWPYHENISLLYKSVAYYGLFVLFTMAIKSCYHAMINTNNVSEMIIALRGMSANCAAIMASFMVQRRKFLFLEHELCIKFKVIMKNEKKRSVLLTNISLYRNFIYFMSISTAFALLMYFMPYAINSIFKYEKNVRLYPGKYPFQVEPKSIVYWMIFSFESSSIWFLLCGVAGPDAYFGLHCFRVSGFLRVATDRFNDITADNPNSKDELRECVSIHQLVLRAKVALEEAYGYIFIWNYIGSAVIMCSILWEVNQAKAQLSVFQISFSMAYIFMKLAQSFVYAYFGSTITVESEKYQDAIYMSNWPGSGNVRLMKDFLIVLLQKTVNLNACGFFLITMQYFEKICKTTISYFFFLQTLDGNRNH